MPPPFLWLDYAVVTVTVAVAVYLSFSPYLAVRVVVPTPTAVTTPAEETVAMPLSSEGIANVINLYDPEMIVIGGGLSEFEDKFLFQLKTKLISKIYNKQTYDLNIKSASLKNDAGIIGASMLHQYLS